ncbi:MAG: MFS transporter [Balneolales bacterium]
MDRVQGIRRPRWVLPAIVIAQFLATSLWFAPNAVISELQGQWLFAGGEGIVTTAVQLGFITGTLCFALLAIADRFHPGNVFLASALAGAVANVSILFYHQYFVPVLITRFLVGFCLAGVYPVGMKMAAGWYGGGLELAGCFHRYIHAGRFGRRSCPQRAGGALP